MSSRAHKNKQIKNYGKPFMLMLSYVTLVCFPFVVFVECMANGTKLRHEIKKVWESLILI